MGSIDCDFEVSLHCEETNTVILNCDDSGYGLEVHFTDSFVPDPKNEPDGMILKTDSGFLRYFLAGNMLSMNFWKGSQLDYDNLPTEQKENPKFIHFII